VIGRAATALALLLAVSACSGPTPSSTELAQPSALLAPATPTIAGVPLRVDLGQTQCSISPLACSATVSVVDQETAIDPAWRPPSTDATWVTRFEDPTWFDALPIGGVPTIGTGPQRIVLTLLRYDDVTSFTPDGSPFLPSDLIARCTLDVAVEPDDPMVAITVSFTDDWSSIDGTCAIDLIPEAGAPGCPDRPWAGVGLAGLAGMTAVSRDSGRIELRNGTDRAYSFRVNTWEWAQLVQCESALTTSEVMRGPIGAGETVQIDVNAPFDVPVTIAFWKERCGEACEAPPFAAMRVARSPLPPMATD